MRNILTIILLPVLILLAAQTASAEKRVALVIGNSAYTNVSALPNPKNDAELMAGALRESGFEVVTALDADRRTMGRAIRKFGRALRVAGKDAVGLFYFAGHGVQARGTNFLIPVNAVVEDHADLEIEALSASDILRQMESAGNTLNLIILDACRNNPFKGSIRSAMRGLARISAASGSLIAFAAAPGQVAADGRGKNSPFTEALVDTMRQPGLPVEQVFKRVRVRVERETGGQQTPWEESSLRGDFYFVEEMQALSKPAIDNSTEIEFWNTIKESRDVRLFRAYLEQYPNGSFTTLASTMIERLQADDERAQQNRSAAEIAFWNSVKNSNDRALIQSYLDKYPNGAFTTVAQIMIERAGEARQPAQQSQQLALADPQEVTGGGLETGADPDLPRKIQAALAKAGCDPGIVDGQWGRKSQRALDRFARYARLTVPGEAVSAETLALLQDEDGRVCPLVCSARQVEKNGRCVTKTCPAGHVLSTSGRCSAKSQSATKAQPKNKASKKKRKRTPQGINNRRTRPAECDDYMGNAFVCRDRD